MSLPNNNTATGGFLYPNPQVPVLPTTPPNLTLNQFLQGLLVGLSGFPGDLVRPQWQVQPPKQPLVTANWLAFGIEGVTPDNNAYVGMDSNDNPFLQRNELFGLVLSIYGPSAYDNMGLIRDGFQLTQNLTTLRAANIGFPYDTLGQHVPDFINELWYERWRVTFYLRRQIQRTYPLLTFLSANGTIYTQTAVNENVELPIVVED